MISTREATLNHADAQHLLPEGAAPLVIPASTWAICTLQLHIRWAITGLGGVYNRYLIDP